MGLSRWCEIYLTKQGNWYLDLALKVSSDRDDSYTYGPFKTKDQALEELGLYSNPGTNNIDNSGNLPEPTASPNGFPIQNPSTEIQSDSGKMQHMRM